MSGGRGHRTAARAERGAGADRVGAGRRSHGARHVRRDRGAGRDRQDGAARGGADGGGRERNARASVAGRPSWSAISPSEWCVSSSSRRWPRHRSSSAPICCRPPPAWRPASSGFRAHRLRTAAARRASIPRSRSCTASTGCARIWPPRVRSAWSSTTRTGRTPRLCATWPSCSRASKSWTSRSSWRPARDEAGTDAELLATVTTDPSAEVIRLPPLTRAAVAELVESGLGGAPDPVFVDACLRATRGTPFLMRVLVERAERRRHRSDRGGRAPRRENRGTNGRSLDPPPAPSAAGACRAARAGAGGPRAERPSPGGATRGPRRGRGRRRSRAAGDARGSSSPAGR